MKLLPLLMLLTLTAGAADYYVATTGNDGGTGAIGDPWLTIYRSTRNGGEFRSAGDTVFIRGGLYSGAVNGIDLGNGIGNSGTPGSPITVKAYPGETVIVTGMLPADSVLGYPVNLKNKAFWTFEGIIYSNNYAGAAFTSCTNFILTNCIYTKMLDTSTNGDYAPGCVVFKTSSQSNTIANCIITNWGTGFTNVASANQWMVAGSPVIFGDYGPDGSPYTDYTFYNLVVGCTFGRCGHDLMGPNHGYLTVRSNVFFNDPWRPTNEVTGWQYYNYGNPRTENNRSGAWGARIQKTGGGDNDFTGLGTNLNTPDLRQVWEDNTLLYGSFPADSNEAGGMGITTRMGIYRRNRIAFCMGSGIYLLPGASSNWTNPVPTNNPAFYHSEMVDNPYGTNCSMATFNCIYNNTVYKCGTMVPLGVTTVSYPRGGIEINNGGGQAINNFIVNNIFWANWNTNVSPDIIANVDVYGKTWHQVVRTNWTSDGALPYPLFTATNGFGYAYNPADVPDLHIPTNSPCVDSGTWLTTAVGSSNGTVMPVFNSLYFSDGNHMVAGDTIQLQGQTTTVTVVANDWTNNVLTLSAPLTWTDGQGVALAYSGLAPDMGAYETTGFALPRGDLHVINGNIGTFIVR